MRLSQIVDASRDVARASGRLEKIERLAGCLRAAGADEVETAASWLAGELAEGRIGLGPAAISKALELPPAPEPGLAVAEVAARLREIASLSGRGSASARADALGALFARATREEQRFLAALLTGELRQGALEGLVAEAVARAAGVPAAAVRRALMFDGRLPAVAGAALRGGEAGLAPFGLRLFRAVKPMLASPCQGIDEALAQLGEAFLEDKLDGARVQVHRDREEVRVFTRALHDVTPAVPEVVEAVRALPLRDAILDGEVLALHADGRPRRFQETMRRFGRKLDVEALRAELPLHVFFFDALRLDGADLCDAPANERDAALRAHLPDVLSVRRERCTDAGSARAFLDAALDAGHEGIMAKSTAAPYAAGARGAEWLKIKPVHTIDLVVLAAEWGSGRRRGWLSNLHLGARDPASGGFVMLGKTFKGLTDALLRWQTAELLARETRREGHVVHVRPELVVEIAVNDVQTSPHYPGGLALRFARVRRYRPDKAPSEVDTLDRVRAIHAGAQPRG